MTKLEQAARQALEALEELHYSSGTVVAVRMYESATATLREALAEQPINQDFETWWEREGFGLFCDKSVKTAASVAWANGSYFQQMVAEAETRIPQQIEALAEQAEQEPVAKEVLKDCAYFNDIDFEQTPPYLRYDTGDSTAKENWDEYCTIQECLREYGYELTDSDVDHDTVCGDVTRVVEQAEQHKLTEDKISHRKFEQEPVAHMYPSDLEKFETNETYAYAYSVAVGNPDERSVPLYAAPVRTKDLTAQEKANIIYAADHRNPMAMIDAAIALYREKNK